MPPTATVPAAEPAHMTKRETARYLRISERTLDRIEDLPKIRLRGRVLFRRDSVDAWSRSHESK